MMDQLSAVISNCESNASREAVRIVVAIATAFGATGRPWGKDDPAPKEYRLEFSTSHFVNIVPFQRGRAGAADHFGIYCPPGEKLVELKQRMMHHFNVSEGDLVNWNAKREHTHSQNIDVRACLSKEALGSLAAVVGWLAQNAERAK